MRLFIAGRSESCHEQTRWTAPNDNEDIRRAVFITGLQDVRYFFAHQVEAE
jgi:hypothetical protein